MMSSSGGTGYYKRALAMSRGSLGNGVCSFCGGSRKNGGICDTSFKQNNIISLNTISAIKNSKKKK